MADPLIGITLGLDADGRYLLNRDYSEAIAAAGGRPVFLPFTTPDLGGLQGIVLAGGGDVAPDLYGEDPWAKLCRVNRERDVYEIALTRQALGERIPVLGICRGIQVLAVAAGGRLVQDLSKYVLSHWQSAPRHQPHHKVEFLPGTRLHDILGVTALVNSFHHQAVLQEPKGFLISARSSDGVIEAIEAEGELFAMGVQWHPECMWKADQRQFHIFQAFIAACR